MLYIELQNWFCVLLRRNNDIIFTNFELYKTIYAQTDFCYVLYYYGSSGEFIYSWIIKDMIDEVLADKNGTMLNWIAASIIAIFVVRGLFWYGQNYLMSYVGQSVIIDIRAAVFKKLQRLSVSFMTRTKRVRS